MGFCTDVKERPETFNINEGLQRNKYTNCRLNKNMEKRIHKHDKKNTPFASELCAMVPMKRITQNQLGGKVQKLYSFPRKNLQLQRLITNL